jgi:hypothetical protein
MEKTNTYLMGVIDQDGMLWDEVEATSVDIDLCLKIPMRTVARNRMGAFLTVISITTLTAAEPAGENRTVLGSAYDLGPSGATFSPKITLSLKYDSDSLPRGIPESSLVISCWDSPSSQWVDQVSTVNMTAHTVETLVSHFSTYAIVAPSHIPGFSTDGLSIAPSEAKLGESVSVSVVITNQSHFTYSGEVSLKIDNTLAQTREARLGPGDKQTVGFTVIPHAAGAYTVDVNGLSGVFNVIPMEVAPPPQDTPAVPPALNLAPARPEPSGFTVSDLSLTPEEAGPSQLIKISAFVTNTGQSAGDCDVVLKINDVAEATMGVTLAPSASEKVSFFIAKETAGIYAVNINGAVGQFRVSIFPPLGKPAGTRSFLLTYYWPVGGVVVGAVLIIVIFSFLRVSRRKFIYKRTLDYRYGDNRKR